MYSDITELPWYFDQVFRGALNDHEYTDKNFFF